LLLVRHAAGPYRTVSPTPPEVRGFLNGTYPSIDDRPEREMSDTTAMRTPRR